jgi:hypothetical protein
VIYTRVKALSAIDKKERCFWQNEMEEDPEQMNFIVNPAVTVPVISPRRMRYPYEPEANNASSSPRRRQLPYEPEARAHHSTVPLFQL